MQPSLFRELLQQQRQRPTTTTPFVACTAHTHTTRWLFWDRPEVMQDALELVRANDPQLQRIRVRETEGLRRYMNMASLFQALRHNTVVTALDWTTSHSARQQQPWDGESDTAREFRRLLSHHSGNDRDDEKPSNSSTNNRSQLQSLRLGSMGNGSLTCLCRSLSYHATLRHIHLCTRPDEALSATSVKHLLGHVLGTIPLLETIHLDGVDLSNQDETLAHMVTACCRLQKLHLVRCRLHTVARLTDALCADGDFRLTHLDLSSNEIADVRSVTRILHHCPSLRILIVAQNQLLGSDTTSETDVREFCQAVATHAQLQRLSLDMNPLTPAVVEHLATTLEERANTSLHYCSLAGPAVSHRNIDGQRLRHFVAVNEAGRGLVRRGNSPASVVPHFLARVRHEPSLLHSLVVECSGRL